MRFNRLAAILLLSAFAWAQQAPNVDTAGASKPELEKQIEKKEQSQRFLGILPMFHVTSRKDAAPLTAGEKFRLFAKGTVDPVELFTIGIGAGISQANNEYPEYGQGAAGYGKRFGASFAYSVSSGFFGGFLYPVALKHDPRYFRRGEGPFMHRVGYALAQEFVCRKDSGVRTVNYSKMMAALTASGISNAYYPPSDRGVSPTMSRTGFSLINGSVGNLLNEFWPDISRRFFHK
jgi:hypothetical protein